MSESKEFTALGLFSEMLPFVHPEGGTKEELFAFYDECVAQVAKTFAPRRKETGSDSKKPYERRDNRDDRDDYQPRSRGGVYAMRDDERPQRSGGFKKEGGYKREGGYNRDGGQKSGGFGAKKPRRYED